MNRFFYYLIFVNMFANMIASVPKILLKERMGGAIISMIISIIVGTIFVYLFVRFFYHFPGKGLPELLKSYLPKWFVVTYMIVLSSVWFLAGLVTLATYSAMIKRFLTPEMPFTWILTSFLLFMSFGMLMKSTSVLYTIETVLIFSTPLILFLAFKAYGNNDFEWDFVRESIMYFKWMPSYSAFSAALYVFLGICNIIIFNRFFNKVNTRINWKHCLVIGATATVMLITTFFIPIGMNGFEKIDTLVYPAITTSDTLRLEYGVIERVIYLFLAFFMAITFISLLVHWHVAIELLKETWVIKKFQWKDMNLTPYLYVAIFWILTYIVALNITELEIFEYTETFFNILPVFFLINFIVFWVIQRRARHEQ